jgi:choline kinase
MEATATAPRAIILAAGVGRRLNAGRDASPKALLAFGGRSLLSRHVGILHGCGVDDVAVVIGFEADRVRVEAAAGPCVRLLENPDYRDGSVVSLWAARAVLRSGQPVLLMDADVLYDRRLMARLLASRHPNCLLLDRAIEPGDEPVKLCVSGGRIVDFRKLPTAVHEWHGESVGFFCFAPDAADELAARCEDYVATGRRAMEYEEPIRDMIQSSPPGRFGFEDISGLPWTEIDFPVDVAKASCLLPRLVA